MEYGHEIIDTCGNKRFFVEGCTYCSMSTGGQHEPSCPLYKPTQIVFISKETKLAEIREKSFQLKQELLDLNHAINDAIMAMWHYQKGTVINIPVMKAWESKDL